jgi:hypothetical protein
MRIVIEIDEGGHAVQVDRTAAESSPPVDAGSAAPLSTFSPEAASDGTDVDAGPAGGESRADAPVVGTDDSPLDAGSAPDFQ